MPFGSIRIDMEEIATISILPKHGFLVYLNYHDTGPFSWGPSYDFYTLSTYAIWSIIKPPTKLTSGPTRPVDLGRPGKDAHPDEPVQPTFHLAGTGAQEVG